MLGGLTDFPVAAEGLTTSRRHPSQVFPDMVSPGLAKRRRFEYIPARLPASRQSAAVLGFADLSAVSMASNSLVQDYSGASGIPGRVFAITRSLRLDTHLHLQTLQCGRILLSLLPRTCSNLARKTNTPSQSDQSHPAAPGVLLENIDNSQVAGKQHGQAVKCL
jgi:hypothetical protein